MSETPNPFVSARESYHKASRRILVVGPPGTGKTTFSVSASKFAGNRIDGEVRQCKDVALFQGDAEGVMGAQDAGLEGVQVLPLENARNWRQWVDRAEQAIDYLEPKVAAGEVTVVIVDLAYPQRLIEASIKLTGFDYHNAVKMEGMRLFNMFNRLQGATVIGNSQIKTNTVFAKKSDLQEATEKASIGAQGGELSNFSADLSKGIGSLWKEHCSFIFVREAKRHQIPNPHKKHEDDPAIIDARRYYTHTQSSRKFEAKSRANSILPARLPGDVTLRAVLTRVYGAKIVKPKEAGKNETQEG